MNTMTSELQDDQDMTSHDSHGNMVLIPAGTFVMGSNEGEAEGTGP